MYTIGILIIQIANSSNSYNSGSWVNTAATTMVQWVNTAATTTISSATATTTISAATTLGEATTTISGATATTAL